jgi:hypothetical protein
MALSRTNRGTAQVAYATAATNTATSSSFTPAAGALMIAMLGQFTDDLTSAITASDTHAGSGSWTVVTNQVNDVSNRYQAGYAWAIAGASPGAGTVTITRTAGTTTSGLVVSFEELSGHDPTTPIRQSITNTALSSATMNLTLGGAALAASYGYSMVIDDNAGTPTTPSGFTQLDLFATANAVVPAKSVYDLASPPTTCAWAGLGTYRTAGVYFEVQAAPLTTLPLHQLRQRYAEGLNRRIW